MRTSATEHERHGYKIRKEGRSRTKDHRSKVPQELKPVEQSLRRLARVLQDPEKKVHDLINEAKKGNVRKANIMQMVQGLQQSIDKALKTLQEQKLPQMFTAIERKASSFASAA